MADSDRAEGLGHLASLLSDLADTHDPDADDPRDYWTFEPAETDFLKIPTTNPSVPQTQT